MPGPRVPDRGDFVWLNFSPQAGREQAGVRPALVLSPALFNRMTGMALLCPVRTRAKGHEFEVRIRSPHAIQGVLLTDQVRSVDWRSRKPRWAARADEETVEEALAKVRAILA